MYVIEKIKYFLDWLLHAEHSILMGRLQFTLMGRKWELHITDEDSWPSVPHLHALDDPSYKINVYNGEVYYKKFTAGKLKEKEFYKLWHDEKVLQMVKKARKYYKEKYPKYQLECIPYFKGEQFDDKMMVHVEEKENKLQITYVKKRK